MSVIQNNLLLTGDDAYNLTRSLRFRSSASSYLNRTPASAGTRTKITLSFWVKRGQLGARQNITAVRQGTSDYFILEFQSDDTLNVISTTGSTVNTNLITTQVFRDPSAWYHIVFTYDSTPSTPNSSSIYLSVNGVKVTSLSTATYPSQNTNVYYNVSSIEHNIAKLGNLTFYLDGYLTEVHNIDGQALTPSSFGEYSATTGVWQPKKYAGTYGTNGFYLPFTDNSALTTSSNVGLGKDFSGNGNYWTTNNISITAGATYDSMTDVPTLTSATASNFATLNPTIRPYPSADNILNANLRVTNTVGSNISGSAWGTIPVTSGKWYAECTVTTVGNWSGSSDYIGVSNNAVTAGLGTYNAPLRDAGYTYASNGQKAVNGTGSSYGATYTTGDVIGIALDADTGSITFYKNGTSQGVAFTSMTNTGGYLFGSTLSNNGVHDWNFGQRPFAYTPPTGFVALNTFNLPTPTIGATASSQANKYFDATLYTGNSQASAITVTNAGGFQPDLVWIKDRTQAGANVTSNSLDGSGNYLTTNSTNEEGYNTAYVTSLNSNGFTVGTNGNVNYQTDAFVGWQWKANGTGVSNTAGSITSTVSANTSSGFSVVTYTGNGTAGATVGHGLGVAPKFIIVKSRSNVTNWAVYHSGLGDSSKYLWLNSTNAAAIDTTYWNNTPPSSTVFTIGNNGNTNDTTAGRTFVAYCFSAVAGYSAFGSYVGNGSTDGSFIYVGFKPRFVMIKRTDSGNNWFILDTARDTFNLANDQLLPNSSAAESTGSDCNIDILSNGFKLRTALDASNGSGGTYIVAAFASSPFKYSLAE